jgi:hypothetical protein
VDPVEGRAGHASILIDNPDSPKVVTP